MGVKKTEDPISLRCGTPGYMGPEILLGNLYDEKVDIYSCGVILYYMYIPIIFRLFGATPYEGDSKMEILNKNKENSSIITIINTSNLRPDSNLLPKDSKRIYESNAKNNPK